MPVVADSSPFVALTKIGYLDVLPALYESVIIPREVSSELANVKRPAPVRSLAISPPTWLSVRDVRNLQVIEGLHQGEIAAISLAQELQAELLLIDELRGRQAAVERQIRTIRTAAVLYEAASADIIPNLEDTFEKLKATNFRVPPAALNELLLRHKAIKSRQLGSKDKPYK